MNTKKIITKNIFPNWYINAEVQHPKCKFFNNTTV